MKRTLIIAAVALMLGITAGCSTRTEEPEGLKIVAHRGYWKPEGSAQNSISSLENAQKLGIYGSEFDINMTADGKLVICHGPRLGDGRVQKMTFAEAREVKLENGETVPTLEEYLKQARKHSETRLVAELKEHATPQLETKAAEMTVAAVKKAGMLKNTIFISFSFHACQEFARLAPGCRVQYLGGKMTPAEVLAGGVNGIDYHFSQFMLHPEWVKEAHDLGMEVNVWTVDSEAEMLNQMKLGVDYITTDLPAVAKILAGQDNQ